MKSHYLSKFGYVLRKELLSEELVSELKGELRGRPLMDSKYTSYQRDTSFPLYIETKNKMYIPKMYGLARFGKPASHVENYEGKQWEPAADGGPIEFTGSLFDSQREPCARLLEELQGGSGGGILSLHTGFGKSVCALYVLSRLRAKTIIIVNKVSLMNQWASEIRTFLPEARVGFLQGQSKVDTQDKDIVIAMLQSLARVDYPDALFSEFGVTLVDEIHNVSSPVFSKVLMKVSSKYTVGLSATPKRSDGCEYVFKWFIGDIVYTASSERKGLAPNLHTVSLSSSEYKEVSVPHKFTGAKQIMFTQMLSELIRMPKRNKLIMEKLKKCVHFEGRKVLVLSDRREHVKLLKGMLDDDDSVTFTYGLFVGQMKIKDLERSKACQVILATYQAFGEGVNEKDLDTLFLVTPKKFIGHLKNTTKNESGKLEQIVGRIFRKEHTEKHPLIVDFQDNFSVYKAQSKQRNTFYKEHFPNLSVSSYKANVDEQDISAITCDDIKLVRRTETMSQPESPIELDRQMYETCML